jgi:acyl-CoA thioesterase YciA
MYPWSAFIYNGQMETEKAGNSAASAVDRFLAIKAVMMPADANPHGTIFGGVILSHIDMAGSVAAHHEVQKANWPRQQMVLVGMDRVEFHRPVLVGDVVSYWTRLQRVGRTSITIHVFAEANRERELVHVTEADVTYVAVELVDGVRRPVAIRGPNPGAPGSE